jgi:hypothetical protein
LFGLDKGQKAEGWTIAASGDAHEICDYLHIF